MILLSSDREPGVGQAVENSWVYPLTGVLAIALGAAMIPFLFQRDESRKTKCLIGTASASSLAVGIMILFLNVSFFWIALVLGLIAPVVVTAIVWSSIKGSRS